MNLKSARRLLVERSRKLGGRVFFSRSRVMGCPNTPWTSELSNQSAVSVVECLLASQHGRRREAQKTVDPTAQLKIQEQLQDESRKQKKQRQEIFIVEDEIAEMRDKMISDIQKRMKQKINKTHLFTINWKLV